MILYCLSVEFKTYFHYVYIRAKMDFASKMTGWGIMFICGMVLRCAVTINPA